MSDVWAWILTSRLSAASESEMTLIELAEAEVEAQMDYWEVDESPVDIAEIISAECEGLGVVMPFEDDMLASLLRRKSKTLSPADAPIGAVLRKLDGTLAYKMPAGALESFGDGFAIIEFAAERYDAAWLIPGIAYLYSGGKR